MAPIVSSAGWPIGLGVGEGVGEEASARPSESVEALVDEEVGGEIIESEEAVEALEEDRMRLI